MKSWRFRFWPKNCGPKKLRQLYGNSMDAETLDGILDSPAGRQENAPASCHTVVPQRRGGDEGQLNIAIKRRSSSQLEMQVEIDEDYCEKTQKTNTKACSGGRYGRCARKEK